MQEVIREGGGPLGLGRLNLVGQARAGKTSLARSLAGLSFTDTSSTIGVEQQLMEVSCTAIDVCAGTAWRRVEDKNCGPILNAVSVTQVAAKATAQKCSTSNRASENSLGSITELLGHVLDKSQGAPARDANSSRLRERDWENAGATAPVIAMDRHLVLQLAQRDAVRLRLSLWDFGGQEVFYALHHLYLTRFATYAVLFNMQVFFLLFLSRVRTLICKPPIQTVSRGRWI